MNKRIETAEFLRSVRKSAIVALFLDDFLAETLVLKGGNLLEFGFGRSTRTSFDLDFSITGDFDEMSSVKRRVESRLVERFRDSGLVAFDIDMQEKPSGVSSEMRDFWGGYLITFKLATMAIYAEFRDNPPQLRKRALKLNGRSTELEIDISRHEYCDHPIAFTLDDVTIRGYSKPLFVCEKLRAICQQMREYDSIVLRSRPRSDESGGRPRDFFDIYNVMASQDKNECIDFTDGAFQRLLAQVFEAKRVPLTLIEKIGEYREMHRSGFESVVETVSPGVELLAFGAYFDFVLRECRKLQSFWHK